MRLAKNRYRLCNFNNLQMQTAMLSKIAVQLEYWEIRMIYF